MCRPAPLVFVLPLICVGPALAGPATALVEDVTGGSAGIETMDYVKPGQVIRLGSDDSIVLSYLTSCTRERIQGGTVTIGREQSEVQFGIVQRTSVPCDGGRTQLTAEIAVQAAGTILRSIQPDQKSPDR
jgi:hypothetical protein